MSTNGRYHLDASNHFGDHHVVEETSITICGESKDRQGSWVLHSDRQQEEYQLQVGDCIHGMGLSVGGMVARLQLPDGRHVMIDREDLSKIQAQRPSIANSSNLHKAG